MKPNNWEDRITLFVAYLIDKNRKSTTIKCYISAIKSVLKDNLIEVDEDRYLLSSLTRACQILNDKVKTRLPIGKDLLHVILKNVQESFNSRNQPYLALLYTTIIVTTYYGLLRFGEVSAGSHPVLVDDADIGINKNKFLFILRTSKTHGKGSKPQKIRISRNNSDFKSARERRRDIWCPFKLLSNYVNTRKTSRSANEPFFVFNDRKPVKPQHLRSVLKDALIKGHFDHRLYGFHSLRGGRALDLLKMGVSVETIKHLGRWKSNAVFTYL